MSVWRALAEATPHNPADYGGAQGGYVSVVGHADSIEEFELVVSRQLELFEFSLLELIEIENFDLYVQKLDESAALFWKEAVCESQLHGIPYFDKFHMYKEPN